MSRWAERVGFDRGDARFVIGALCLGGGVAWALAPGWGLAAVGGLIVAPSLVEWVALVLRKEGGEG